jgi:UDP-glucose 4-epimerase
MKSVHGTKVAITGGTGSFGNAMASSLLVQEVEQINIFSRDEAKQDAMRREFDDERLRFFLGDVRDAESVRDALRGVDYVFHAAALKQVPSCEFFPDQAVKTNVRGSYNVLQAAIEEKVRCIVCLSTDKAVYPVNAMGMSKALMEKTAQAAARNHPEAQTRIAITRYGNVMFSRGSVIPMFVDQVLFGKPMTITEPTMTRFLMSLSESVDLVYHAFERSVQGDLFVRKAPAATIETLARAVASLLGNDDPAISVLGVRHGEKIHETLLSSEEMVAATEEDKYFSIPLDGRSLNYKPYFEEGVSKTALLRDYTSENAYRLDLEETKELLLTLPEIREMVRGPDRAREATSR